MLRDWCTWDDDYNRIVQRIRKELVQLATAADGYTAVLMQGSGTFGVEAAISTAVPDDGTLLVLANGAYGLRMATIAERHRLPVVVHNSGEVSPPDLDRLAQTLETEPSITHVAVVHCETTTGMLNPVREIGELVKSFGKVFIVDAMSSFGGIPMDVAELKADYLISCSNKCVQGVPGFSFVIAGVAEIEKTGGRARSLSLDMYDQWREMEEHHGKWRFTSPTHVVRAFAQAMEELKIEGGIAERHARYSQNHRRLVEGMRGLGFSTLLPQELQSPIITAFHNPPDAGYEFGVFYEKLKRRGFVIYPGKVTETGTFRIGTIGDITPDDITRLIEAVRSAMYWL
jgi:2-aminoethylphosphonate-pyruvate transaminase